MYIEIDNFLNQAMALNQAHRKKWFYFVRKEEIALKLKFVRLLQARLPGGNYDKGSEQIPCLPTTRKSVGAPRTRNGKTFLPSNKPQRSREGK